MQDSPRNVNIQELPPSGERPPIFIVGDVHGCARELGELLRAARRRVSDCRILLVGDLFTKGPDPVGVYELIQEFDVQAIKGNHDWALITSILHAQRKGPEGLPDHTRQTLHLIRYHRRAMLSYLMALPHALTGTVAASRKGWEPEYPLVIVHAGIDPVQGLRATPERMMLTARWVRWEGEGEERRLVLVHSTSRSEVANEPVRGDSLRFRWHELHQGPELIVFGHDAKQGLFRKTLRNGRPVCVGLDTGCTYGRSLTGYFPEFDDAIQVQAARIYFDMSRNIILTRSVEAALRSERTRAAAGT